MSQRSLPEDKFGLESGYLPVEVDPHGSGALDSEEGESGNSLATAVYVGIVVFYVLYFFRPEDFVPGLAAVPLQKIVGSFTGIALVGAILAKRVQVVPEVKLLLALLAYLCLCVPFSIWTGGSFDLINTFSKIMLVLVATMCAVTTIARLRTVILVQIAAMLTMALFSFGQDRRVGRMFGIGQMFSDPNDLALNLCVILPFCVALLLCSRGWLGKLFWAGAVAITLLAIVSTYSRGGFLGLIAVLPTMCRQFTVKARSAILLFVLMAGLSTVAILVAGKSTYLERIGTISDTGADTTGSAQERKQLLTRSLEVTLEHPLFGIGPGQFPLVSGVGLVTHNTYTQFSSEAGIPALVLFLVLVVRTFTNLRLFRGAPERTEAWYLSRALYCGMVGYLVGAFFLSTAYWLLPYLLLAYSSVLRRFAETTNVSLESRTEHAFGST
jgi:putative inorganic carbon (HCO3(-)) transporter